MAIRFAEKQARWPLFFIAFLKCSEHNYQLYQVLKNFKYSFYFDGITLIKTPKHATNSLVILYVALTEWESLSLVFT